MNRRFRLAPVERRREVRLEDAARALAAARRALATAVAQRNEVASRLTRAVPPPRATPHQPELAGAHRELLRARLAQAAHAVAEAEEGVARALGGWHLARTELRAVQTLHERHRAAVADADARAEQRGTDDLAAQAARRAQPVGPAARAASRAAQADRRPTEDLR